MQTSLQGIARKARKDKRHRFRNLFRMLNEGFLRYSWPFLRKNAAVGIDRVSAEEYFKQFDTNVKDLIERVKRGRYRAKLVRRRWIPKGNGKLRPLGIPVLEDKLLQIAVSLILRQIFEEDFLNNSYGYRPKRDALEASKVLRAELQFGRYGYVVEADIKGFFDNIDHGWMVRMLEERIKDRPFIRLIKKWLKAGIMEEDGKVTHPVTGTPQGGIVSPVLANIYLHYALDLWFEKVVKKYSKGAAYLLRYADDFVCLFQYKDEAERFYRTLPKRLGKFKLELSKEKTRIIRFSRFQKKDRKRFEFLGFEYTWAESRKGKQIVRRRTSRKKFRQSLTNLARWCREHRSDSIGKLMKLLNQKLRGYYNYYGVIGNYPSLKEFFYHVKRILFKWLNRRSQKRSYNWQRFDAMIKHHRIERPRIVEKYDNQLKFAF